MDTVSSPVSHPARDVRLLATLVVLGFVVLILVVALGAQAAVPPPHPADPLLGPFRWSLRVPVA